MPAQKFERSWRRSCAGVEQGNGCFPAGKRLIEHGEISNDKGQKSETQSGFKDSHKAAERSCGRDIAEAKGKESGAADIKSVSQTAGKQCSVEPGAVAKMDQGKSNDHAQSPEGHQQ